MSNSFELSSNAPSLVWKDWLWQLRFLESVNDDQLRLHLGFGYYLGAPIETDIWRANRWRTGDTESGERLIEDYCRLVKNIDPIFLLTELDQLAHIISIPLLINGRKLNLTTDVVRMQVEVSNLVNLGVLDGIESILEVGGGYGQLCAGLVNANVCRRYYIVDFPEVLTLVHRWISQVNLKVNIHSHSELDFEPKHLTSDGIHLIPNSLITKLKSPIYVDLMINTNSFFEMSTEQVKNYISSRFIKYNLLYSSNRDRQILNQELQSLTELFTSIGILWPNYNSLTEFQRSSLKKKVYLVHPGEHYEFPCEMDIEELHGIFGTEMPALG
jgi:hypothetical protein